MTTFSRPGAYIQETVSQQQYIAPQDRADAIGAFIGKLSQGPTTPTLVSTWSDFVKYYGGLDYTLPTSVALYQFFANGGRDAYVRRVTQSGATTASVTLTDSASAATLTISAKSPGAWATATSTSGISVEALAYGTGSRFSIVVYGPVATGADSRSNILEQFTDLSVISTDARYAPAIINATSAYITATDLSTSTLRPLADGTLHGLTGGTEGTGGITSAILGAATSDLDQFDTPLILNIPDAAYFNSSDWAVAYGALINYADTRGDSFVVVDPIAGQTASGVITAASGLSGSGKNAAVYYPWLTIPDTTKAVRSVTVNVPPGGAIVGQYQATDASRGVFKAPAGYGNRIALALGLEKRLTNAELDTLNGSGTAVNAIRIVPGTGICVMGARTISNLSPNQYVNVRRSLNYIKKNLTNLSNFATFENNDAYLWAQLRSSLGHWLAQYWAQGGLRGANPVQAYYVLCDDTTTTESDIASGRVNIQVGVALQYPAEFIVITIGQITGSAAVVQA